MNYCPMLNKCEFSRCLIASGRILNHHEEVRDRKNYSLKWLTLMYSYYFRHNITLQWRHAQYYQLLSKDKRGGGDRITNLPHS